jgi:hypothetical protein
MPCHERNNDAPLFVLYFNNSKPSSYFMYHPFNIKKFCVLPTECIYVLCGSQEKAAIIFPILVFITQYVYFVVQTQSLNIITFSFDLE